MRYNPYEPTKKSSPLIISIFLTTMFVVLSIIAINPKYLFEVKNKYQSSKVQVVTKLLQLAGETPETAPIAIVGSCENIEDQKDCESTDVCTWESRSIPCDFQEGICPNDCQYIPKGVINCNTLADDIKSCENLPGNYCNWQNESCYGDYPNPESCSGTMILPESCLQSN